MFNDKTKSHRDIIINDKISTHGSQGRGAVSREHRLPRPFRDEMSVVVYNVCARASCLYIHARVCTSKRLAVSTSSFPNSSVSIIRDNFKSRRVYSTSSWTADWSYSWRWPRRCLRGGFARRSPMNPTPRPMRQRLQQKTRGMRVASPSQGFMFKSGERRVFSLRAARADQKQISLVVVLCVILQWRRDIIRYDNNTILNSSNEFVRRTKTNT